MGVIDHKIRMLIPIVVWYLAFRMICILDCWDQIFPHEGLNNEYTNNNDKNYDK